MQERRMLSLVCGTAGIESRLLLDLSYQCRYRSEGDRWVAGMKHALRFALDNVVEKAVPTMHATRRHRFARPLLFRDANYVDVAVASVQLRHHVSVSDLLDVCRDVIADYCSHNKLDVTVPPRGRNRSARIRSGHLTQQGMQHFGADLRLVDGPRLVSEDNVIRVVFS